MFVFVGERPSDTAKRRGWTWRDGRLAGKQLFDALLTCGIAPDEQEYTNLFIGPSLHINRVVARHLAEGRGEVVAMGELVSRALSRIGIAHKRIVHPAARGRIRRKDRYSKHVRSILTPGI